jgi:hypothetical protein
MRTYLTFGDFEGKLDMLPVECSRCQRKGRYSVAKLIEKYGRRGNMMKWKEQLNGDCPKRDAHELHGRCDLICPDLQRCCDVAKEVLWSQRPRPLRKDRGQCPRPR